MDAKDILGLPKSFPGTQEKKPRQQKEPQRKPDGISREVYALTGGIAPLIPTIEVSHLKRRPVLDKEKFVQTTCHSILGRLRSKTFEEFEVRFKKALKDEEGFAATPKDCSDLLMSAFDESFKGIEQVVADTLKVQKIMWHKSNAYVEAKLSHLMFLYEEKLNNALYEPFKSLLNDASDETWPTIRRLLQRERMTTLALFTSTLTSSNIDQTIVNKLVAKLDKYATSIVEFLAREEARRALMNLNDRFNKVFSYDSDSMTRLWTGKEDIKAITKMAHSASLKSLSVIAAIRVDGENDNIEETLQLALMNVPDSTSNRIRSLGPLDALAFNTWEDVPLARTLITPIKCKSLWRKFRKQTNYTVERAIAAQETCNKKNNQLPPPWAITAILILGFNEFWTILSNPSYLLVIFVAYLLGTVLYVQLHFSGEFRSGVLFGILSLPMKFHSALMSLIKKQRPVAPDTGRNLQSYNTSPSSSARASNETSDSAAGLRTA